MDGMEFQKVEGHTRFSRRRSDYLSRLMIKYSYSVINKIAYDVAKPSTKDFRDRKK